MRNNWTIIAAAVLAIVTATLAIAFRPVQKSGEWETSQTFTTTSQTAASNTQVSKPLTDKDSENESHAETTTVQVNLTKAIEKLTTETTGTTRHSSKLVSKLHEIAESDREWLSQREKTTSAATTISPAQFKRDGKIYYNGYYYTYYSEKRLPGPDLNIPGRHSDGNYVRDADGYIVLASCDLPKGTIVQTPFGTGKVYDYCPTSGTIDVYVSW